MGRCGCRQALPAGLSSAARSGPAGLPGVALLLPSRPAFLLVPGSGQSLPPAVQAKMEGIFRTSFAGVRVHIRPRGLQRPRPKRDGDCGYAFHGEAAND